MPAAPMDAYFGENYGYELTATNFMLKELRLWGSYLTQDFIKDNRFRQVDTSSLPDGLVMMNYYRLMAGSFTSVNLAMYQPGYDRPQTE